LGTANLILERCQDILQGAIAAAAELGIEEDSDEDLDEVVGRELMWDPDC
jgi:hypothetical protein